MNEMKDWLNKTCEDCYYKEGDIPEAVCRRFPPICWGTGMKYTPTWEGLFKPYYLPACAEFKENLK